MVQQLVYVLNLSEIKGDGDFPCPKCGTILSPDDETEENYCLLDSIVKDDNLEELFIQCQKCGSTIRLTGFSVLNSVDGCVSY